MGQVSVSVNGRSYRLVCGDGEEPRLRELAALVNARVDMLVAQFGQPGEARLLLMAALLTTDELLDTRVKLDEAVAEAAAALRAAAAAAAPEPVPEKRPDNSRKSQRVELPGKAQAGSAAGSRSPLYKPSPFFHIPVVGIQSRLTYIVFAAGRVRSKQISRAYKICLGAVPDRSRGSGHMAPTLHL